MKYSIRGILKLTDEQSAITLLNSYQLWKFKSSRSKDGKDETGFYFEVWLNSLSEKDSLFNDLKSLVNESWEFIDWHECTHDETVSTPCVIAETYRGE